MLKNKKFQAVLALLIAIGLWIYVMGTVDPVVTTTVHDIQVEKINEDVLEEKGLQASLDAPKTVTIVLKGARSDVNEAKDSEIRATIGADGKFITSGEIWTPDIHFQRDGAYYSLEDTIKYILARLDA